MVSQLTQSKLLSLRTKIRLLFAVFGLSVFISVLASSALIAFGLDYLLRGPWPFRLGINVVAVAFLVYCLYRFLVYPLSVKMNVDDMALCVERGFPGLKDRLISSLQLARRFDPEDTFSSSAMVRSLMAETEQITGQMRFGAVAGVNRRMSMFLLAGLVALLVLTMGSVAFPNTAEIFWQRIVLLAEADLYPRDWAFKLANPEDVEYIPSGDKVRIEVWVVPTKDGSTKVYEGDSPRIEYVYDNDPDRVKEKELIPDQGRPGMYFVEIEKVTNRITYTVKGPSGIAERNFRPLTGAVNAVPRPEVDFVQHRVYLPLCDKMEGKPVTKEGGKVLAYRGSLVRMFIRTNRRIKDTSYIQFVNPGKDRTQRRRVPLLRPSANSPHAGDMTAWEAEFVVDDNCLYNFVLFDLQFDKKRFQNANPQDYTVAVLEDRKPRMDIRSPYRTVGLGVKGGELPIRLTVEDDKYVDNVRLLFRYQAAGGEARSYKEYPLYSTEIHRWIRQVRDITKENEKYYYEAKCDIDYLLDYNKIAQLELDDTIYFRIVASDGFDLRDAYKDGADNDPTLRGARAALMELSTQMVAAEVKANEYNERALLLHWIYQKTAEDAPLAQSDEIRALEEALVATYKPGEKASLTKDRDLAYRNTLLDDLGLSEAIRLKMQFIMLDSMYEIVPEAAHTLVQRVMQRRLIELRCIEYQRDLDTCREHFLGGSEDNNSLVATQMAEARAKQAVYQQFYVLQEGDIICDLMRHFDGVYDAEYKPIALEYSKINSEYKKETDETKKKALGEKKNALEARSQQTIKGACFARCIERVRALVDAYMPKSGDIEKQMDDDTKQVFEFEVVRAELLARVNALVTADSSVIDDTEAVLKDLAEWMATISSESITDLKYGIIGYLIVPETSKETVGVDNLKRDVEYYFGDAKGLKTEEDKEEASEGTDEEDTTIYVDKDDLNDLVKIYDVVKKARDTMIDCIKEGNPYVLKDSETASDLAEQRERYMAARDKHYAAVYRFLASDKFGSELTYSSLVLIYEKLTWGPEVILHLGSVCAKGEAEILKHCKRIDELYYAEKRVREERISARWVALRASLEDVQTYQKALKGAVEDEEPIAQNYSDLQGDLGEKMRMLQKEIDQQKLIESAGELSADQVKHIKQILLRAGSLGLEDIELVGKLLAHPDIVDIPMLERFEKIAELNDAMQYAVEVRNFNNAVMEDRLDQALTDKLSWAEIIAKVRSLGTDPKPAAPPEGDDVPGASGAEGVPVQMDEGFDEEDMPEEAEEFEGPAEAPAEPEEAPKTLEDLGKEMQGCIDRMDELKNVQMRVARGQMILDVLEERVFKWIGPHIVDSGEMQIDIRNPGEVKDLLLARANDLFKELNENVLPTLANHVDAPINKYNRLIRARNTEVEEEMVAVFCDIYRQPTDIANMEANARLGKDKVIEMLERYAAKELKDARGAYKEVMRSVREKMLPMAEEMYEDSKYNKLGENDGGLQNILFLENAGQAAVDQTVISILREVDIVYGGRIETELRNIDQRGNEYREMTERHIGRVRTRLMLARARLSPILGKLVLLGVVRDLRNRLIAMIKYLDPESFQDLTDSEAEILFLAALSARNWGLDSPKVLGEVLAHAEVSQLDVEGRCEKLNELCDAMQYAIEVRKFNIVDMESEVADGLAANLSWQDLIAKIRSLGTDPEPEKPAEGDKPEGGSEGSGDDTEGGSDTPSAPAPDSAPDTDPVSDDLIPPTGD